MRWSTGEPGAAAVRGCAAADGRAVGCGDGRRVGDGDGDGLAGMTADGEGDDDAVAIAGVDPAGATAAGWLAVAPHPADSTTAPAAITADSRRITLS
jgi:hypothetical protein